MNAASGILQEAMLMLSPDKVMPVRSPAGCEGCSKIAPVNGAPA